MHPFLVRTCDVIVAAAPEIFQTDWRPFGTNYRIHDDAGNRKFQGMILRADEIGESMVQKIGFLPDPAKSSAVLGKKFQLLELNPSASWSLEHRNPAAGWWGGAIRASLPIGPNRSGGLTGLPEIGDHLFEAHAMRLSGALTADDWDMATDRTQPCIVAAMEHAGMTSDGFDELVVLTANIMNRAHASIT